MLNVYVYVYVQENYEKDGCMRKDSPMEQTYFFITVTSIGTVLSIRC